MKRGIVCTACGTTKAASALAPCERRCEWCVERLSGQRAESCYLATIDEVAAELGYSRALVSKIEAQALGKIRAGLSRRLGGDAQLAGLSLRHFLLGESSHD